MCSKICQRNNVNITELNILYHAAQLPIMLLPRLLFVVGNLKSYSFNLFTGLYLTGGGRRGLTPRKR